MTPCPRCGSNHIRIPTRPVSGRLVEVKDRAEDWLAEHPLIHMAASFGAVAGFFLFAFNLFALIGGL